MRTLPYPSYAVSPIARIFHRFQAGFCSLCSRSTFVLPLQQGKTPQTTTPNPSSPPPLPPPPSTLAVPSSMPSFTRSNWSQNFSPSSAGTRWTRLSRTSKGLPSSPGPLPLTWLPPPSRGKGVPLRRGRISRRSRSMPCTSRTTCAQG